jgi:hypothetical protein
VHINGTACAVLGQITRTFHYRDKDISVKLYKTYVRPHLEFCTPAWSPWNLTDIDCLEKVLVKMLNMVTGLVSDTYEGKLAEVGLQTLAERRHMADMITVHKMAHSVGDFELFDRIPGRQNTRAGADPLNGRPQPPTLKLRKGFFSYRAAMDWNNILAI